LEGVAACLASICTEPVLHRLWAVGKAWPRASRGREPDPAVISSNLFQMAYGHVRGLHRALLTIALGLSGLLVASCAGGTAISGGSPGGGGSGATVTIGPADAGKTITLRVGDTLVFAVAGSSPSPGASRWLLVSYPKNLISLLPPIQTPPFRFKAQHAGTGTLELSQGPRCGSPGPAKGDSMQCPVFGDMNQAEILSRLASFHLRILAR
jgi:hypothetical protein